MFFLVLQLIEHTVRCPANNFFLSRKLKNWPTFCPLGRFLRKATAFSWNSRRRIGIFKKKTLKAEPKQRTKKGDICKYFHRGILFSVAPKYTVEINVAPKYSSPNLRATAQRKKDQLDCSRIRKFSFRRNKKLQN